MKKTVQMMLFVMGLSVLATPGVARDSAGAILHGQGVLWTIEKPDLPTSYLFGTMHVSDERVTQLPVEVTQAFNRSRYFVMEMLPTPPALEIIARGSYFQHGRSLKQLMRAVDSQRLSQLLSQQFQLSEQVLFKL